MDKGYWAVALIVLIFIVAAICGTMDLNKTACAEITQTFTNLTFSTGNFRCYLVTEYGNIPVLREDLLMLQTLNSK